MKISKTKLKLILARKEMSMTELADLCGVTRNRMYRIVASKNLLPKTVGKVANALECDISDLVDIPIA